jgi:TetR/AcrR family tetracycline transcriptional repressor
MDGLSLRRLAQEPGVQGPALYRNFAGKQDLLRAMADSMFAPEMAVLLLQLMEEAGFTTETALFGISTVGNHVLGSVIAQQEMLAAKSAPIDPVRFLRLARGAELRAPAVATSTGRDAIVAGLRANLAVTPSTGAARGGRGAR